MLKWVLDERLSKNVSIVLCIVILKWEKSDQANENWNNHATGEQINAEMEKATETDDIPAELWKAKNLGLAILAQRDL